MYLEKFPLDYQICFIKISTCKLLHFSHPFSAITFHKQKQAKTKNCFPAKTERSSLETGNLFSSAFEYKPIIDCEYAVVEAPKWS